MVKSSGAVETGATSHGQQLRHGAPLGTIFSFSAVSLCIETTKILKNAWIWAEHNWQLKRIEMTMRWRCQYHLRVISWSKVRRRKKSVPFRGLRWNAWPTMKPSTVHWLRATAEKFGAETKRDNWQALRRAKAYPGIGRESWMKNRYAAGLDSKDAVAVFKPILAASRLFYHSVFVGNFCREETGIALHHNRDTNEFKSRSLKTWTKQYSFSTCPCVLLMQTFLQKTDSLLDQQHNIKKHSSYDKCYLLIYMLHL